VQAAQPGLVLFDGVQQSWKSGFRGGNALVLMTGNRQ
jgi:hypothetical protein